MNCLDTPPMGGCMCGWLDGWVHVKSLKIKIKFDLFHIIQFFLKMYDLWRHPQLSVG